jgi:hypothetical protein
MLSVNTGLGVNRMTFIHRTPLDTRPWGPFSALHYSAELRGRVTYLRHKSLLRRSYFNCEEESDASREREREKPKVMFQREQTDLAVSIPSLAFLLSLQFQTRQYLN